MSKYEPLKAFLQAQAGPEVPLTFSQIEEIIGAKLPSAAHAHRAFWSNNAANNVMTRSWLEAGYVSEQVDMTGERVVFRRADGMAESPAPPLGAQLGFLDRIRASLGGTVTVADGVDLTAPTGETWDAER